MQIGQVIRKYRKEKNLTQEEIALRLGVTPPAVNKWERGVTLPDITLLAPLARLLGISCDTLLAYRDELSAEEINARLKQAQELFAQEGYAAVWHWAKAQMAEYPNCEQLCLNLACLLESWRIVHLADAPDYDDFLSSCFARLLQSGSEEIRLNAAEMLFNFYLRRENYAQAEKMLGYLSVQNPERKRKQALIYSKTERLPAAWQAYEQLLFSTGNRLALLLHDLFGLAKQENDPAKAKTLADKQAQLANLLGMGEYHEVADRLDWAIWQQDAAATVQLLQQLFASLDSICAYLDDPLYEHMDFKRPPADFDQKTKAALLANFQNIENLSFIKKDAAAYQQWQQLTSQLADNKNS